MKTPFSKWWPRSAGVGAGAGEAFPGVYPLTIYFDGACPLCLAEMTNLQLRNVAGLLRFEDASRPDFKNYPPGTDRPALMALLHVQCADGRVLRGAEAFRLIYAGAQLRGLAWLISAPGLRQLVDWVYPFVARNRYRIPRSVAHLVLETALRRAAERRAGASACATGQCATGQCDVPAAPTNSPSKE